MWKLVLTGTTLSIASQFVTGKGISTSSTQFLALAKLVLGRKLSAQQLAAVVLVNAGLLIRALAPNTSKAGTAGVFGATSHRHLLGGGAILAASIGYSLMGVLYDMLMRLDGAPPYSEITNKTAKIGLGACLLYQIAFVAPRWSSLVTEVLAAHHVTLQFAALALAGVGAVFSMHNYWQAEVIRAQGAVALGIANAIRGALVTFLAGMFFCTPDAPWQCSTGWTHLSALVVTVGAVLWASARKSRHPQRSTQEPALDKQSSKSL
ncbi:hypothetical protein WJX72_011390 [[Myrmecia] bisecta]|uniref:Uncharacterized protein n=1 Tax=[Myrmecia] bisecta TaxID=41462 RepID=A0AAW1PY98_9CHLO